MDPAQTGAWSVASSEEEPLEMPQVAFAVDAAGKATCTPQQQADLKAAYDTALAKGIPCLAGIGETTLRFQLLRFLANGKQVTFTCDATFEDCAAARTQKVVVQGRIASWFWPDDYPVVIGSKAWDTNACGGDLAAIVFHELSHFFLGHHEVGNGAKDPGDRVYACQATCFGMPDLPGAPIQRQDTQSCATCIGSLEGDPRCAAYPKKACDPAAVHAAWCDCPAAAGWYADIDTCAIECPSGFACFTAQCHEATAGACPSPGNMGGATAP